MSQKCHEMSRKCHAFYPVSIVSPIKICDTKMLDVKILKNKKNKVLDMKMWSKHFFLDQKYFSDGD